jgi:hypothetical protein
MPTLSDTLATLAEALASEVLVLARSASVDDILSEPRRGPGRPPRSASKMDDASKLEISGKRMGATTIDSVASLITSYVKSHQGAKATEIRKALGIPSNKWLRPLALALASKGLSKKGEKRATAYFVK